MPINYVSTDVLFGVGALVIVEIVFGLIEIPSSEYGKS